MEQAVMYDRMTVSHSEDPMVLPMEPTTLNQSSLSMDDEANLEKSRQDQDTTKHVEIPPRRIKQEKPWNKSLKQLLSAKDQVTVSEPTHPPTPHLPGF